MVLDGLFLFNPARHDYGDKQFLGHRIAGAGLAEVDQAVDLLARHPATAHFISAKLAAYFLGDAPPPALVDRMARTFLASDGDIAAVLQTLYASPEFARSLDAGVFRTRCTMYSSLRLAYAGMPTIVNPRPALNLLRQLGQPLNQRLTPDGYPLAQSDWAGPGQMTARFETARAIAAAPPNFYRDPPRTRSSSSSSSSSSRRRSRPRRACPTCSRPMPAPGCSTGCRPTRARRWRRPPIRATSIPTCWPRRNSCGASPRPHNPRPPRRSSCTVAACSNSWPPPLRAGHRPPLRRAGRGTTGCWSYSCAAPTTPPACWCRPPATSITSRGPPSPSPPRQRRRRPLPLADGWALHPALAASLMPFYQRRELAFLPFAGTEDTSRSHFETQNRIELGQGLDKGGAGYGSGFLNRLAGVLGDERGQAAAFTEDVPQICRGAAHVRGPGRRQPPVANDKDNQAIASMYRRTELNATVAEGQRIMSAARQEMDAEMQAANGNAVSADRLEQEARRIARFMRDQYNLGFVDVGGWDTHVGQGGASGALATRLGQLGRALAATPTPWAMPGSGPRWWSSANSAAPSARTATRAPTMATAPCTG